VNTHPNTRVLGAVILALLPAAPIAANGTGTLGQPVDFYLAPGTGFAQSGTGLEEQPRTIIVDVPRGARVKQVLLYWKHRHKKGEADDNVLVNGQEVTGALIGGPTLVARPEGVGEYASAFRQDITNLELIHQGRNVLVIDALRTEATTAASAGAGVLVTYDASPRRTNPTTEAETKPSRVWIKDGLAPTTVSLGNDTHAIKPVTFEFPSARRRRFARLGLMVGNVGRGTHNRIGSWTDVQRKPVVLSDVLGTSGRDTWSSLNLDFEIPAGAKKLTIAITGDAAITWVGAFLHLTRTRPVLLSSRGMPPEYWIANPVHWGNLRPTGTVSHLFGRAVFQKHHAKLGKQTLLQALSRNPKSPDNWPTKLVRDGIAALLSTRNGGVYFPLDDKSILSLVRAALESGDGSDISWEAVSAIKMLSPGQARAIADTGSR